MNDDANQREKREQKLRFIEILLIVGGIISSLGLKNGTYVNEVFGYFLIGSLLYFFAISNMPTVDVHIVYFIVIIISFIMSILIISTTFALLVILPLIPSDILTRSTISLLILTWIFIAINLIPKGILPNRIR